MSRHETYPVQTFTEVYSSRDEEREKSVRQNLRWRILAAGLDPEKASGSIHWHPEQNVFIMVVTVIGGQ